MEEFKCTSYSTALDILKKFYSFHPDNAVLSMSALELLLVCSIENVKISVSYYNNLSEFEISFITENKEVSFTEFHYMNCLLNQFKTIYNEFFNNGNKQ